MVIVASPLRWYFGSATWTYVTPVDLSYMLRLNGSSVTEKGFGTLRCAVSESVTLSGFGAQMPTDSMGKVA